MFPSKTVAYLQIERALHPFQPHEYNKSMTVRSYSATKWTNVVRYIIMIHMAWVLTHYLPFACHTHISRVLAPKGIIRFSEIWKPSATGSGHPNFLLRCGLFVVWSLLCLRNSESPWTPTTCFEMSYVDRGAITETEAQSRPPLRRKPSISSGLKGCAVVCDLWGAVTSVLAPGGGSLYL